MAQCPVCHANIADDFGLVECANCGAQLLVHMDGRVEHSGSNVPEADPPAEVQTEPEPAAPEEEAFEFGEQPVEFDFDQPPEPPPAPSQPDPEPEPAFEPEAELAPADPFDEKLAAIAEEPLEEEPLQEMPASEPTPDFFEPSPADNAEPEVYSSTPPAASPDLSDIAHFGNSDATAGRDGSLRYNVMIEGIDTSDVREAFRDIVTDRKFLWDADQLLRKIKNGHVRIENIGPAKAHMLISRLRTLPVKVEWEQYAITQA